MIQIRQSNPHDANQIIAGINLICVEGGAFYTSRFVPSSVWSQVLYKPQDVPDHLLAVAEWSGNFAGAGRLFPGPEHSYMRHVVELGMFVLPTYRRQGVGRALLNWMLAWAKRQAYEKVTLDVFATNTPALKLYHSIGCVEEGRQKRQIKVDERYIDRIPMAYWL